MVALEKARVHTLHNMLRSYQTRLATTSGCADPYLVAQPIIARQPAQLISGQSVAIEWQVTVQFIGACDTGLCLRAVAYKFKNKLGAVNLVDSVH
jgi:hypothetical protein